MTSPPPPATLQNPPQGKALTTTSGEIDRWFGTYTEIQVGSGEIKGVGHGFERVIDLVCDAGRHAAHRSELFALEQRLLRSFQVLGWKSRGSGHAPCG